MRSFFPLILAAFVLTTTGCMSETRVMAESCQHMLHQDDLSGSKRFVRDAEARIAALDEPQNKFMTFVRDLQDPDALTHKPALEQCVWQLKSRQP